MVVCSLPQRKEDKMKMRPIDLLKPEPRPTNLGVGEHVGGRNVLPIRSPSPDSRTEQLMPYEKAAKAIYVRANGLPAYHRAMGNTRGIGDGGESNKK